MPNNIPPTKCPEPGCGGDIIEKKGKKKDGTFYHFWGCSNFATKGCRFSWSPEEKEEKKAPEEEAILEVETLDTLKSILTGIRQIYVLLEEIRNTLKPKS